jgi:hypothetical protein
MVKYKKPTSPVIRPYKPRIWRLYGSGYISTDSLEEQILQKGGEVLLLPVYDEKVEGQKIIVYGVFYKTEAGEYFDVLNQRLGILRNYVTEKAAVKFLHSFAERCGEQYLTAALPALTPQAVIKPGELRERYIAAKLAE